MKPGRSDAARTGATLPGSFRGDLLSCPRCETGDSTTSVPELGTALVAFAPPVPNPAATGVDVRFSLAATGHANLEVYDVSGRRVSTLLSRPTPAGAQRVRWEATDERGKRVPAGRYFLRLNAAGKTLVRDVVVLP